MKKLDYLGHALRRLSSQVNIFLIAPLMLTACASITPPPSASTAHKAEEVRTFHDAIELNGRLSVQYQRNGRDEAVHGNFIWSQTSGHTNVTLLSPLGQTIAIIDVMPNAAKLLQAGQPPRVAADVDSLMLETLGWPLPVAGLRYWLQGFATDKSGHPFMASPIAQELDHVTTRDGWHIRYASWQDSDANLMPNYPKRIDLERFTTEAGDVSIKIVIDSWQIH